MGVEFQITTEQLLERVLEDIEIKVRDKNNLGQVKYLYTIGEKKEYYINKILEEKSKKYENYNC